MSNPSEGWSGISAVALADLYRSGEACPEAVARWALHGAAASSHVFIALTPERAMAEARAAALRWRAGRPLSALDGVPIAWKDLFDLRGVTTTAGSKTRMDAAPAGDDCALAQSAARAGMVCVGKTNLSEFAYSGLGINSAWGTPRNPALDGGRRAPGGSSSGSALAVAAGIVPVSMASDTAGSIRIPAAFNGLVGYKSSAGRYPSRGVFGLSETLDCFGPIARTVADCIALDAVLTGAAAAAPGALSQARFIIDSDLLADARVAPAVRENTLRAAGALERAGARIELRPLATLERVRQAIDTYGWLGASEAYARHRILLASPQADLIDPRIRARLESARGIAPSHRAVLLAERRRLAGAIADELAGAALLLPAVAHTAPALAPLEACEQHYARLNLDTLWLTRYGSFLDMPAVALPSGTDDDDLPTGIQLLYPSGQDTRLLQLAASVESAITTR